MDNTPILEVDNVSKLFSSVIAISRVSLQIYPGEVTCLLGDNGAGKSTLIKVLAGVHQPTEGQIYFEGSPVYFSSPRIPLSIGIATVYQDLALIPLMPVWRNFFMGSEPTKQAGPFTYYDHEFAKYTVREEMAKMGIDIRDPDQPVGTMSGGERQCLAIARAVYFGAKVLILDEPTAALGVKQAGTVLRYIAEARKRNLGVIFITHNPSHADVVANRFVILKRGRVYASWHRDEVTLSELIQGMAGGEELKEIKSEIDAINESEPAA